MTTEPATPMYETMQFRPIGWAGAILFTLAPPTFLHEWWLVFYTTAVEENPAVGPMMAISCVATFASIPLMIAGRRKRLSPSPSIDELAIRMPALRRRVADVGIAPGQAPQ